MDIYWIENGKQKGPVTVPDIISMVQMGELSPDTRGWHTGCSAWMPLRELPALSDFLQKKPAQLQQTETSANDSLPQPEQMPTSTAPAPGLPPISGKATQTQDKTTQPTNVVEVFPATPVARLVARMTDTALYAAGALGIAYSLGLPYDTYYTPSNPFFWIPMVVLEALFINRLGTTPGKFLMGIRMISLIGSPRISFGRALLRSALVFFLGTGLMMFPVGLVMMLFSYWNLRSRGICLWDARAITLPVLPQKSGFGRFLGAAFTIYLALTAAGLFMQPWMPTMLQEIEKQSPDAAHQLRELMYSHLPPEKAESTPTIPQPKS